jgi:hypothetical protein
MQTLIHALWNDEAGFIVSAELVLIQELDDVAYAFGVVNQGFRYQGLTGQSGQSNGATSNDGSDFCDTGHGITSSAPTAEGS